MSDDFGKQLAAYSKRTQKLFDKVLAECIVAVTKEMVALTPARTGFARSNYFWNNGSPSGEIGAFAEYGGAPSIARAQSFAATATAGGFVFLSNNVPYILDLEYGSSMKAPAGMSRTLVARWPQIGAAAVERAKS